MNVYQFVFNSIDGEEVPLSKYKDKVLLVVNTASKCGFTPQYDELQKLYEKYNSKGLEILGFPTNQFAGQEPGTNEEVKDFCLRNYGVTFQMFEKTNVRGTEENELFKFLTQMAPFKGLNLAHPIGKPLANLLEESFPDYLLGDSIKWNFTKFLIDRDGNVISRYEPTSSPFDMEGEIQKLLAAQQ